MFRLVSLARAYVRKFASRTCVASQMRRMRSQLYGSIGAGKDSQHS